jgi:hypothetical protein
MDDLTPSVSLIGKGRSVKDHYFPQEKRKKIKTPFVYRFSGICDHFILVTKMSEMSHKTQSLKPIKSITITHCSGRKSGESDTKHAIA